MSVEAVTPSMSVPSRQGAYTAGDAASALIWAMRHHAREAADHDTHPRGPGDDQAHFGFHKARVNQCRLALASLVGLDQSTAEWNRAWREAYD